MSDKLHSDEVCEFPMIHETTVHKVKALMLSQKTSVQLAELFKIFGDPTRVKLLHALKCSEMCVCDLAATLSMTHSAISHQLRVLKSYNLVSSRKEGKVVYYTLADDHVMKLLTIGLEHINE